MGSHSLFQGIFPTRDQTPVSCTAGRFFTIWVTREAFLSFLFSFFLSFFFFYHQTTNTGLTVCLAAVMEFTGIRACPHFQALCAVLWSWTASSPGSCRCACQQQSSAPRKQVLQLSSLLGQMKQWTEGARSVVRCYCLKGGVCALGARPRGIQGSCSMSGGRAESMRPAIRCTALLCLVKDFAQT